LAPVSLDNNFFDTQNLKIFSCVDLGPLMPKKSQSTPHCVFKAFDRYGTFFNASDRQKSLFMTHVKKAFFYNEKYMLRGGPF
jgi:hypothetical protein